MRIAVASGKGGTGKTTVAVSLFLSLAEAGPGSGVVLLDCDVEEPNAALFLEPKLVSSRSVGIRLPEVDTALCTHCGRCAEVCAFHAIAVFGESVLVFPQLCHGCGSCTYNCPEGAITERLYPTGTISWGHLPSNAAARFGQGELNVGEAMANPVIRQLKETCLSSSPETIAILDAPPGNACPVVETLRGADFALLVTEPTPFGLHDLRGAVEVAREEMGLPVGVLVNREGIGDGSVQAYCEDYGVPLLMTIPQDRAIAEAYAEGVSLAAALPAYRPRFLDLFRQIVAIVAESQRV